MYSKQKANLIITLFLVCIVSLFVKQELSIITLNSEISRLEQSQTTNANIMKSEYLTNLELMSIEIGILKEQNEFQAIQITGQQEQLEYYALYINDLEALVDEYYITLQEAIPYYQFPTTWEGQVLTKAKGSITGPSGRETYYNLPMGVCIKHMRQRGYTMRAYPYWIREDGAKMLGPYVMIAANWSIRPLGSIVETSMGWGIVVDTGEFINTYPYGVDIATNW